MDQNRIYRVPLGPELRSRLAAEVAVAVVPSRNRQCEPNRGLCSRSGGKNRQSGLPEHGVAAALKCRIALQEKDRNVDVFGVDSVPDVLGSKNCLYGPGRRVHKSAAHETVHSKCPAALAYELV